MASSSLLGLAELCGLDYKNYTVVVTIACRAMEMFMDAHQRYLLRCVRRRVVIYYLAFLKYWPVATGGSIEH